MKKADDAFFERDPFLRELVSALRALRPEVILLFGSRARGDALSWSDYDVVVVRRTRLPFLDRLIRVRRRIRHLGRPVQVLVYTPEEFRQILRETPFGRLLRQEGIVLYVSPRAGTALVSGSPDGPGRRPEPTA
jgi:predicted nucleotidyltransferase